MAVRREILYVWNFIDSDEHLYVTNKFRPEKIFTDYYQITNFILFNGSKGDTDVLPIKYVQ